MHRQQRPAIRTQTNRRQEHRPQNQRASSAELEEAAGRAQEQPPRSARPRVHENRTRRRRPSSRRGRCCPPEAATHDARPTSPHCRTRGHPGRCGEVAARAEGGHDLRGHRVVPFGQSGRRDPWGSLDFSSRGRVAEGRERREPAVCRQGDRELRRHLDAKSNRAIALRTARFRPAVPCRLFAFLGYSSQ